MLALAVDGIGHEIPPRYKKHRSFSSPQSSAPPSPATEHCPRERIASLMPLQEDPSVRKTLEQYGAKLVLQQPEQAPRAVLHDAISVVHNNGALRGSTFDSLFKAIQIDPNAPHPLDPYQDEARAQPPVPRQQARRSDVAKAPVTSRRRVRPAAERRLRRNQNNLTNMAALIVNVMAQQSHAVQTLRQEAAEHASGQERRLARAVEHIERFNAPALGASRPVEGPDWDRQFGVEYICARWRTRGKLGSKPFWHAMAFIALRCLKELGTWALGLVSFGVAFRLYGQNTQN